MADTETDYLCVLCDQDGGLRCGRCKEARYCSAECQRADWRTHKMLCKYNLEFATSKRPSPAHVRAILFPEKEEFPRFVWVYSGLTDETSDNPELAFDFSPLVECGAEATADSTIIGNGVLRRALHPHMVMCKIQTCTSTETMSLSKIDARISKAFTGSLIFIGETNRDHRRTATDLTTAYMRHAIDELAIRSDIERRASIGSMDRSSETRTGVIVNSVSDIHTFTWPFYQRFDFHPTGEYTAGYAAPAAIDLPLCIYKIEQSVSGIGRTWDIEQDSPEHTPDTCCLPFNFNHVHLWLTNPVKGSWLRFAPFVTPIDKRIHHQGSFLVARVDGKPLYPIHLEAMYGYFRNRLIEYGEDMTRPVVLPSGQVTLTTSEAAFTGGPWVNKLSKDGFEAWYEEFVREEEVQKWYPRANETLGPYEV